MFRSLYRHRRRSTATRIPGNYLFHGDGTVTFLDFGLVKHFTPTEMDTFASMVEAAAVDHDAAEFRGIVEAAGLLRPDAPVSTEEVGDYFSQFYERCPRRRGDDLDERSTRVGIVRHTFDRSSPIAQYATVPRAFVFIQRINLGLYALLGELRATRQLPADRRGAVAVHPRRAVDPSWVAPRPSGSPGRAP